MRSTAVRRFFITILVTVCTLPPVAAQDFSPAKLEQWLRRFPQADLNKDGKLTRLEAIEAVQKLRRQRRQQPIVASPPTHENVRYGEFDRNVFDLWLPESEEPTPLIVFIHGGGFVGGDKDKARRSHNVQKSLDRGVAFAAIHYRLIHPQGSDMSDPQRTGLQNVLRDSARALQYLRHHASKYNLDPTRVACYGGSAGAGTSIWLAFHDDLADPDNADPILRESTRISAAGMLAGQFSYDLTQWDAEFAEQGGDLAAVYGSTTPQFHRLFAMTPEEYATSDVRHDVDMRGLISSDDPPVFALTNNPDEPVVDVGIYNHHPLHAQLIEARCKQHGVEVQCLVPKVRPEDAQYLKDHPNALLEFLFRHLGVTQS